MPLVESYEGLYGLLAWQELRLIQGSVVNYERYTDPQVWSVRSYVRYTGDKSDTMAYICPLGQVAGPVVLFSSYYPETRDNKNTGYFPSRCSFVNDAKVMQD